jgi:hypothetical protein
MVNHTDFQPIDTFLLEVNYDSAHNEIVILANNLALEYLKDLLDKLIGSTTPGKHFHIDSTGGLDGNVAAVIIGKK